MEKLSELTKSYGPPDILIVSCSLTSNRYAAWGFAQIFEVNHKGCLLNNHSLIGDIFSLFQDFIDKSKIIPLGKMKIVKDVFYYAAKRLSWVTLFCAIFVLIVSFFSDDVFLDLLSDFSKSLYVQRPTSIGLLDSNTASLYVPVRIASTVFFVDPVNLAI